MPHPGLFSLLAEGPVRRRREPTQFRQTIRARLSRNARLGQDSSGPASTEGCHRKNFRQISGSISPTDRARARESLNLIRLSIQFLREAAKKNASDPA